jgi:hypothetical protein
MELRVDRELEDAAVALPCDRAEKGREEASRRALFGCSCAEHLSACSIALPPWGVWEQGELMQLALAGRRRDL